MFRWHKEMDRLDLPVRKILHLWRSISDVQVMLPGLPAQEATAYLCAHASAGGARVAVVMHLHDSGRLAFYIHEPQEVTIPDLGQAIEAGVSFAESMGFILTDLDFQQRAPTGRAALWSSLPLGSGAAAAVAAPAPPAPETVASDTPGPPRTCSPPGSGADLPPAATPDEKPLELTEEPEPPAASVGGEKVATEVPSAAASAVGIAADTTAHPPEDDPGAATAHPGRPAPYPSPVTAPAESKTRPGAAEIMRRREQLRQNLGRFLASL